MYVIIWKFTVRPGLEPDFEGVYGPNGLWAQFFHRGPGFIETELLRDLKEPRQYFTIDRWESKAAFENFQAGFAESYEAIDKECGAMTEFELKIGNFDSVGNISNDEL